MSGVNLGFENKLWEMADKLRGNIESAEYKHIVLGLIFLKYISDAFEEKYNELVAEGDGFEEDEDFYLAENIFYVPEEARWRRIRNNAHTPDVGVYIDEAMRIIEEKNDELKGVLPKNYARPEIDKIKLGELIDLFSFNIGSKEARAKDTLGRVYEYFLGKFGSSEGEFYTPPSIVKLLVNMIEPKQGKVYDPCCGSGGMFVQSQKFVEEYGGYMHDILVFGQEYTATTWRLCKMNLAVRGVNGDIGTRDGDTFANDMHRDRKMDYVLANPPFNVKDYYLDPEDTRWKYGIPPKNNANYAWIQHIISKLSVGGVAGFVLANGSMSTSNKQEAEIRRNIIEAGLVDCIVTMPTNLFYNVTIPVCLWFLSKKRENRKDKILFVDAREMGEMVTRVHRELSDEDIQKVCKVYHAYRDGKGYEDVPGFCKAASLDEVRKNDYNLVPGRYVEIFSEIEYKKSFLENGYIEKQISELGIEVIDGDRGKNYPHKEELLPQGNCLFLSANNVTANGFSFDNNVFITAEKDSVLRNGK